MTDIALDFSGEIKSVTDLALAFGALKTAATATDNVDLKNFRSAFKTLGTASTAALREVLNGVKSSLDELTKAVNAHKITSVVDQAAVQTGLDTLLKTASSAQHQLTLISVEENAKRRTDEATTAQKILQIAKDAAEALVAEEKSKGAKLIAEAVKLRAEKKAIGDQELNEIKAHYEKVKAMDVNDANARFQAMSLEAQRLRVLRVESLLASNVAPSAVVKRYGSDATIAALQSESFTRSAVIKEGTAAEVAARLERIRAVGAASQAMLEQRKLNNASLLAVIRDQEATDKMQIAEMRANTAAEAAAILERNTAIKASVAAAMNSATGAYQKYNPNTGLAGGLVNMPVNPIHPKAVPDTNALIDATKSLTGHHKLLNDGVRGLVQSLGMYSATITSVIPMLAGMALGMAAIKPLKVGAEFEQSMFVIHEVAGTSTADMVKVKDAVLDIGKSTQYGPLEVAKGLETLTLAGLATVDALQAIKPVLHFAATGAVSLEAAAETLVAVATAYKYSAQNIEAVGDIIAKTAADTMASVTDMSAAFKMSTIVAQQYGMSLNDTAMALGMLAQIGIRGTMAGTSYRNMLTEFNKGSGKAADGIKLLGVELKNADGSAKDLMTSMESLSKGLITKNSVSQGRLLDDIANERGGKSLAAFQAAFNVELNKSNPLLQQEVNLLLASGKAAEAKKVAEEAVTATYARMREAVQKSIDSTAAYTFLVNLEEQFTTLGTYKGLLASLQTDFVKAFDTASDSTKLLTLSLRETFNTPEFTQAVAILANAVLDVVTALAKLAAFTLDSPVASVAGLTAAFLTCKLAVAGLGLTVDAVIASIAVTAEVAGVSFGAAALAIGGVVAAVAAVVAGIGYLTYAILDNQTDVEKAEAAKREEYIKTHTLIVELAEKVLTSQQGQIDTELSRVEVLNKTWVENRRLTAEADAAEWQSITALGGKTSEEGQKYHAQAEALRAQRVTAAAAETKIAGEAMLARITMWEETKLQIIEATRLQKIFNLETLTGKIGAGLMYGVEEAAAAAKVSADVEVKAAKEFADAARTRAKASTEALVAAKAAQQAYAALDAAAAKVKPYGEGVGGYAGKPKFAFPTEAERAAKQEAKKDAKDAAEALEFYNSVLNKSSGYLKTYAEDQNKLALVYEKGWATYEEYAKAVAEYMKTQPFMLKAIKDEEAATKARVEATVKSINAELDAYYKSRDAIDEVEKSLNALAHTNAEYTESLEFEQSLMGLGAKERETAIEQYKIIAKYKAEAASIEAKTSDPVVRAAQLASNAVEQAQAISNAVRAKQLTDWNTTFDSISSGLTDAILNAGKDGGKGLRDYLEAELLTKPFKMVIQAMVQPIAQRMTNALLGTSGGGSAGLGDLGYFTSDSASSMGKLDIAGFSMKEISTGLSYAKAVYDLSEGKYGSAIGTALGTALGGPVGGAIGSAIGSAVDKLAGGETRSGGEYRSNITDGAKYAYGPSGGDAAASQVKLAINTTTEAINATLKQVGSAVTLTAFAAGYETSDRDRGGAYAGGTLSSGASFGQDGSGDNYAGTKYDPTKGFNQDAKGAVAALDIELKQSIIETLQAAGDIPKAVTKVIDDALAKANVDSVAKLSAEATDATMAALNTVIGSVEIFNNIVTTLPFKDLADLSFDAAAGLIEFSGGIDNLASNLGGFYSNFYAESDQLALKTEFASRAFADLGQVMPAVDGSMRDWYRSLIDVQLGLDQSDPAIAKVTAGLLGMQGAVNELAPVVEVIKSSISGTTEAVKNQAEWQIRLDIATGATTAKEVEKAAALAAADDATDLLIEQFYALEGAAKNQAEWQQKLDLATGATTTREIEKVAALAAADDATDKLIEQFYALEEAADMAEMNRAIEDTKNTIRDFYTMLFEKAVALKNQQQGWADTYSPPDPAELAARIALEYNTNGTGEITSAAELLAMTATDLRAWAATASQLTVTETVRGETITADVLRGAFSNAVATLATNNNAEYEASKLDGSLGALLGTTLVNALKTLGIDNTLATSIGTAAGQAMADGRFTAAADWTAGGINTTQAQAIDWVKDTLGNLAPITLTATVEKSAFEGISGDINTLISQITEKENYVAPTAPTTTATAIDTSVFDGLTREGKDLNISLLELQGKFTEAKEAAKLLATDGMTPANLLLWEENEIVKTKISTLTEHNALQDELNGLRDTEAQALTRQRNALDESNRALFDQVQGFKSLKSLSETFAVPQTATQAGAAVSAAGYNVNGLDTAGIASYITGILNAPGMLDASGDLTAAGLATVATLNGLTGSLKTLGTAGDKAAEKEKTIAATKQGLQDQLNVLNKNLTQTQVDRANIEAKLILETDETTLAMQRMVWGLQDIQSAVATQGSIFDKLATDPQKQARAQTNVNSVFAGLGIDVPATAADFLALSESANTQTAAGQNLVSVLGTVVDDFSLLHSAVKDVTSDYNRALLEAAGNTTGLEAFDKAISDAALIASGWTQAMIDNVDTTRAATKAAQITQDFNRALLVASGDDSALAKFDRAISDAALVASGWTAAQVATIQAVEAAAKTLTDIASIKESRTAIASGRQTIVAAQAGFDAPAYWLAQQAMTSAKLSSTNDPALKIKYSSEMQTAIDNGLQAQITALDKARDTRIKALTDEAQLVDDNAAKAKQAAQEMYSALDDIAKYARGLSTTDLSPLDPKAKLDAAANEYQRLLGLTQGGDTSAAGQLTGASDTYLNLAKDYYASTAQYSAIFGSVESQLTALGVQASVYEQIANAVVASYDLDTATAAIDQQYQSDLLALQNAAISKYDVLDSAIAGFQTSLESRADAQYVEIQTLNVNTENVGNRVTQSGSQVTAAVNQSTNATQTNNALLMQVIALLIQANNTAAVTATATQQTASSSTLATAA